MKPVHFKRTLCFDEDCILDAPFREPTHIYPYCHQNWNVPWDRSGKFALWESMLAYLFPIKYDPWIPIVFLWYYDIFPLYSQSLPTYYIPIYSQYIPIYSHDFSQDFPIIPVVFGLYTYYFIWFHMILIWFSISVVDKKTQSRDTFVTSRLPASSAPLSTAQRSRWSEHGHISTVPFFIGKIVINNYICIMI